MPRLRLPALLLAAWAAAAAVAVAAASPTLHGIVQWPPFEVSPAAISVTLTPHGSSSTPRTTIPAAQDGSFTFAGLPAGSHLLEVTAPGLAYHSVWVWVRNGGAGGGDGEHASPPTLEAAFADAPTRLLPTSPLTLRPAARTSPFDARGTFDPVAFAKTPYGLLLLFVAFAVFALPRLRIDPDEYDELMAEQRGRRGGGAAQVGGGGGGEGEGSSRRRIQPGEGGGAQQRRGGQERG